MTYILGLNAYALTGEEKYRQWALDYMGAWKQRAAKSEPIERLALFRHWRRSHALYKLHRLLE